MRGAARRPLPARRIPERMALLACVGSPGWLLTSLLLSTQVGLADGSSWRSSSAVAGQHGLAGLEHVGPSARSRARLAFCSTTSMVMPSSLLSSPKTRKMSWTISGARPSDGSSSSSSLGRLISARATASICCSPPRQAAGRLGAPLAQAGEDRRTSARCRRRPRCPCGRRRRPARLSSTDRSLNVPRPWGTWATPGGRSRSSSCPVSSLPSSTIDPWSSTIWQMARSVVVLPAPLAPRMTTTSPAVDVEVDAVEDLDRAVAGVQVRGPRAASWRRVASCCSPR